MLGDLQGDVFLRFGRGRAQMRRADDVLEAEQRIFLGWLDREHIEAGAGDMARFDRGGQRHLVDEPTARAIDDAHAGFRLLQCGGVDDVLGLLGQRRMQRDEVGALEQFIEFDLLDAQLDGTLWRQERIEGDHLHAQADATVGDDRADIAATEHAKHLARDLGAHELRFFPLAGLRRTVGGGDLPGDGQHQRDGVLGGRDRIAERRVHDDDAARGRRLDVDVVDADAGAADDLQLLGLADQLFRHLGGRADGEPVILADDFFQLLLGEAGFEVDGDARVLEDLHGGGGEFVGNENAGSGGFGGHGNLGE